MILFKVLFVFTLLIHFCVCDFGIFSVGVPTTAAVIGGVYYYLQNERCHGPGSDSWINYVPNFSNLDQEIFGQHIALRVVPRLISKHLANPSPAKPLVISFHGWTGIGKNHFSTLITERIYKAYAAEHRSNFVHVYPITWLMSGEGSTGLSTSRIGLFKLKEEIRSKISNCDRSMFIIDETDKLPENYLDTLKPLLDGTLADYRKAIFLFLGNSGGKMINNRFKELRQEGVLRHEMTYHQFEKVLSSKAFLKGAFRNSHLITSGVIDLFVPFLPLEVEHVKQCITHYLRSHYKVENVNSPLIKELVDNVLADTEWVNADVSKFARYGCRRVKTTVDLLF